MQRAEKGGEAGKRRRGGSASAKKKRKRKEEKKEKGWTTLKRKLGVCVRERARACASIIAIVLRSVDG